MDGPLEVGRVVYLMSGGPAMTVAHVYEGLEIAECRWFVDGELQAVKFRYDELTFDPGPEPVPGEPLQQRRSDDAVTGRYVAGEGVLYGTWPPSPTENG